MTEVRWTPQAADDLQAIYDFIGRDSPHYTQVVVEDLLAAIDRPTGAIPADGPARAGASTRGSSRTYQTTIRIVYRVGEVIRILFRASRLFPSGLE